ncbi:hypothetical protein PIB30_052847 [Stylosanthes scabra]|uniref:Uncharacterized protein n=1 Tax=Stylosanthes scabra TaxID=79078 RepID=A0ABU6SI91_9FABA|nr:hypothetical protein [Stylosanthes scabra]
MAEDELPAFDGIGGGYGWSISAWQFWNSRGTPEAQRLEEVSRAFSGRSLIWFQLWSLRNPNADWDTFDLAFLHQFQPDMRPILPEICWKEVKDWEIEWTPISPIQIQRFLPDAETREDDWNAPEVDAARESTGKSAHRPPPEPPNFTSDGGDELRSLTHEIDGTTQGDGDEVLAASNRAENGAVAKGKVETEVTTSSTWRTHESVRVEADNGDVVTQTWWCSSKKDNDAADQNRGDYSSEVAGGAPHSAEIGASTKGNREIWAATGRAASMKEEGGAALIVSSDNGHRGRRVLPFFGKSPILLAATFPWDRDSWALETLVALDGPMRWQILGSGEEQRGSDGSVILSIDCPLTWKKYSTTSGFFYDTATTARRKEVMMVVNTATQRSTTLEGKRHGMGKEEGWISTEASVVVEKEGVTMQLFVRRWQDVGTAAMAAPVVVGKIWRQQGELGKGETWFLEKRKRESC